MKVEINIWRNRIVLFFAVIVSLLILAHVSGLIWEVYLGNETGHDLFKKFNINEEGNISTWFSSSMILFCAFLLGLIAVIKKTRNEPYVVHWISLSLIFVFLSCDETAQLHEWTVAHVHRIINIQFTQYIGWVVPYSILVILFAIIYIPFFLHLSNRIKVLFAAAGFVYVGGALGMELLTGAIGRVVFEGKLHFLFGIIEELFEMGGIVIFIYALLSYLSWDISEINIRFKANEIPDTILNGDTET
jgi:hypothetical protein